MTPLRLVIVGDPEPQGSAKILPIVHKKRFPLRLATLRDLMLSVVLTSDNAKLKAWRSLAAAAARDACAGQRPHDGPVSLEAIFFLAPPKHIPARRGGFPIARGCGDLDKYARAAGDALSGIAYVDDVQIVALSIEKRYAETPARARVELTITPIAIGLPLTLDERISDHADRTPHRRRAAAAATVPW